VQDPQTALKSNRLLNPFPSSLLWTQETATVELTDKLRGQYIYKRKKIMSFLSLPPEIILHICQYLSDDLYDLNRLLRVNWRLAILLRPVLLDAVCDLRFIRQGTEALYSAADREDEASVQRLVKKGILRLPSRGRLLNDAIETQSERVVRRLLECGVEARGRAFDGQTPLFVAARVGSAWVVELLLSHAGIEVNTPDILGRTPLLIAAANCHEEVVRLLLSDARVSVNVGEDSSSQTPLTMAAMNGHDRVVQLLLDHPEINVNAQTVYGETPLKFAVAHGHDVVTKMLIEDKRVDINLENCDGRTPFDFAAECSHSGIMGLLLDREGIDISKAQNTINRLKSEWPRVEETQAKEKRKNSRGWARKSLAWIRRLVG